MSSIQRWVMGVNPEEMTIENKTKVYEKTIDEMKITYKDKKWKFRDIEDNDGRSFEVYHKKKKKWILGGWLPEHQEMFNHLIQYNFTIHN